MLKITNISPTLNDDRTLKQLAADYLKMQPANIDAVHILSRSIDARRKNDIKFVYSLLVDVPNEKIILKKFINDKRLSLFEKNETVPIVYGNKEIKGELVVAGAGPAGLFCALLLAKHGYRPVVIERGMPIDERKKAVQAFWRDGRFSPDGNIQFGEGGAGTFSDGKLTTRVNDPLISEILSSFVAAGAPEQIKYESKPHIGTDILYNVVKNVSSEIIKHGGRMVYHARLDDINIENGRVRNIALSDGSKIDCNALVLTIGHSARDTYKMLLAKGFLLESKPFSIGVRVEHPQSIIDEAQYGSFAGHEKLGAADYALVFHDKKTKRSAYSFCMCPGGVVVASASAEGEVVTNGMSYFKRNSGIANSALVVGVDKNDFGSHPLNGIEFQQKWEKLAFEKGGSNYYAPCQTMGSFLHGSKPELGNLQKPTYLPGVNTALLREVLPSFVTDTLSNAFSDFARKIKGFDTGGALLTGVETRTSAPLRILRDEKRQAVSINGVYPAGEGSGYAGGIMSAALDGYKTALALMSEYKPQNI